MHCRRDETAACSRHTQPTIYAHSTCPARGPLAFVPFLAPALAPSHTRTAATYARTHTLIDAVVCPRSIVSACSAGGGPKLPPVCVHPAQQHAATRRFFTLGLRNGLSERALPCVCAHMCAGCCVRIAIRTQFRREALALLASTGQGPHGSRYYVRLPGGAHCGRECAYSGRCTPCRPVLHETVGSVLYALAAACRRGAP